MNYFSKFLSTVENYAGRVTRPLEEFSHRYLLAPERWIMSKIDPLSYVIEGTVFKKILQVSIFPVFMTLTIVIGFELIKNGYYSRETYFGTVLTLFCMGVIFAPLERLIPFSRKWMDDKDEPTDVMVYFGNYFFERYVFGPLQLAILALAIQEISPQIGRAIWPSHWHPLVQVLLLLAVKDFFRYWYHRWMHENKFMWRWHSVHHSSTRLYWFNSNRAHPIEPLGQGLLWGIPLAFVQAPLEIAFVTSFLGTMISRFQHTNLDLILGPMEYVFSSPKNHRYHHSKKIEEGNSNYGGDVMFWDLLFGTFHLPKGGQPSDDIGVSEMPDYPQTWIGLMLAPFTFGNFKPAVQKTAERRGPGVMEELPETEAKRKQA